MTSPLHKANKMNEAITFILNIKEMVSGGLAKIATTAQSTFTGIDKRVANTQRQFSMAGKSVVDLNTRLQLLTQKRDLSIGTADIAKANREIYALERRIDKLQNKGLNKAGAGGGMRLPWWLSGAMIGGLALGGVMSMVKVGADQQRDVTGLSTFMGKDKAQSFYNSVQQDARITPFVTHDLMAADRMLISTGMSADRARKDIMNLANAVAATGGSNYALERMAQHLQMIKSMGHASYLQLKEFTTNGINIMQLLSDATGKHIKMAHGMTVSYEAIERALAHAAEKGGLFYNALFAQSQTIWGKWSTLVDDLQLSAGKIVTSQSGAITGLLDLFDKYAQRLPEMADQWAGAITAITKNVIWFVGALIDLAKWVYHNWTWLKYVVGVIYAFKVAMWAAATVTGIYNSVMTIAAMRVSLFAAAEGEATAAALTLDAAMAATPWGAIALGIVGVGVAITALVSQSKNAGKDIADNLDPKKVMRLRPDAPKITEGMLRNGSATRDWWNLGVKENNGIMNAPLTAQEQAYVNDQRRKAGVTTGINDALYLDVIRKAREAAAKPFVVGMPSDKGISMDAAHMAAKAHAAAADNTPETGDGINSGAITGGGNKQLIFNIQKGAINFSMAVKDGAEALGITEEKMEEWLLRWLYSAKRAM